MLANESLKNFPGSELETYFKVLRSGLEVDFGLVRR